MKSSFHHITKHIVLLIVFLLSSCTGWLPQRDCSEMVATGLEDYFTIPVSLDQMQTWVTQYLQVSEDRLHVDRTFQKISWSSGKTNYVINLKNSTLSGMHIDYNGKGPTMRDLIACLGQPDSYYGTYGRRVESFQLSVYLFWQDQGIIASGGKSYFFPPRQASLRLNSSYRLNLLNRVQPGTLAEAFPYNKPTHAWPKDGGPLVIDFE